MLVSVVIRTYNESKFLPDLLEAISIQKCSFADIETVVIDSGSTDGTLDIAQSFGARITSIQKEDFTFGRSLNQGCDFADGDFLVFVSGHCIPKNSQWLEELVRPLYEGKAAYSYGKQEGKFTTKFSESCHFKKFFPEYSMIPQKGFFCNNANAAVLRSAWKEYQFDEDLTGLEDMHLAKRLVNDGLSIAYVATSVVFHIHDESWRQVKTRYEREAYALKEIMPEVHFNYWDFIKYFFVAVKNDLKEAKKENMLLSNLAEIITFRFMMYLGTYKGNHVTRALSSRTKFHYFYPVDTNNEGQYD